MQNERTLRGFLLCRARIQLPVKMLLENCDHGVGSICPLVITSGGAMRNVRSRVCSQGCLDLGNAVRDDILLGRCAPVPALRTQAHHIVANGISPPATRAGRQNRKRSPAVGAKLFV
jgi:hypothetical protein